MQNFFPLTLGLIMFSFLITGVLVIPFINFLYKIKFTRKIEAPKFGKIPLFDKLHDKKAGTPVGGGVLIIYLSHKQVLGGFYRDGSFSKN